MKSYSILFCMVTAHCAQQPRVVTTLEGFEGPRNIAFTLDGKKAYIVNHFGNFKWVKNIREFNPLSNYPLTGLTSVEGYNEFHCFLNAHFILLLPKVLLPILVSILSISRQANADDRHIVSIHDKGHNLHKSICENRPNTKISQANFQSISL